jgi:repressor LexA
MSKHRTRTGERILYAIKDYQDMNGRTPSYREIADMIGVKSTNTIGYHVQQLEADGYVTRLHNIARSLVVVKREPVE